MAVYSLVGQMRSALLEIKGKAVDIIRTAQMYNGLRSTIEKFSPDRIIIESSGSAFPATLAWQVRQLEDEGLKLDSVVSKCRVFSIPLLDWC